MGLCGPDVPDPSKGYAAGIRADLESLPWRRMIEAASATGDKVTINIPGKGPMTFDFSGLGQDDYAAQYGDQMAQQLLALQRDFGPAYVEERLHELEQSDPEGSAMRNRLWESIRSDAADAANANRPAADEMQRIILEELAKGGELDPVTADRVSQAVRGKQVATGNFLGNAATSEEAGALAGATEAQGAQRQQAALEFLMSGATPEDVSYRRSEQALTNLGSFLSGTTPMAQFGQLSGAQNGIVPNQGGVALPGVNPNAGVQGIDFANGVYGAQQAWANNNVNPWMAGLAGGVRGAQVWAGLGGRAG
jgi:hypothetical protein